MSWTLIERQALTSSVASVTLGSGGTIPQTYKTLKLVVSARSSTTGGNWQNVLIYPNGSTSNGSFRSLYGTGSAAGSDNFSNATSIWIPTADTTANTFGNAEITIPNYAGSTNKPWSSDSVGENNATSSFLALAATLWSSTTAITSLVVQAASNNFVSGSTFTLYGLA